jgi:hypothetical protein
MLLADLLFPFSINFIWINAMSNHESTVSAGTKFLKTYIDTGAIAPIKGHKVLTEISRLKFDHLMLINLNDASNIKDDLKDLYPPFGNFLNQLNLFNVLNHEHDFALINLLTQKILLIGLGRKCRIFCNDCLLGYELNWAEKTGLNASQVFTTKTATTAAFEPYFFGDTNNVAMNFVEHFCNIGSQIREREFLDITPYDIDRILNSDEEEKLEILEELGIELDDFQYAHKKLIEIEKSLMASLKFINKYFPDLREEDLNSEDFL